MFPDGRQLPNYVQAGNRHHEQRSPWGLQYSRQLQICRNPEDKFVVTPNSDTPCSYLWMDLRAEPIVIAMPKIEPNRYYTAQLVDLYTYNFAYLGTRAYGNDGGGFLVAGPGWNGSTPSGSKAVIHSETQSAYALFRTLLFNIADLPKVNKVQSDYHAEPLSSFLHQALRLPRQMLPGPNRRI